MKSQKIIILILKWLFARKERTKKKDRKRSRGKELGTRNRRRSRYKKFRSFNFSSLSSLNSTGWASKLETSVISVELELAQEITMVLQQVFGILIRHRIFSTTTFRTSKKPILFYSAAYPNLTFYRKSHLFCLSLSFSSPYPFVQWPTISIMAFRLW